MAEQMSQAEQLEEQKKSCPFCQSVAGNIPASKVYEDEKILAILDINPATKGHLLVIPKEHFPLLPMCPPDLFTHLFSKVRDLCSCVEEGILSQGTEIFIAGGGAAGQQSYHFMIHIVPREDGDGLDIFTLPHKKFPSDKLKEVKNALAKNLTVVLGRKFGKIKVPKLTKEQVLSVLESNPQVKQAILQNPEEFKKLIPTNAQLKALFSDVSVDEIIGEISGKTAKGKEAGEEKETGKGKKKESKKEENNQEKEQEKDLKNKDNKKGKKNGSKGSAVDLDTIADLLGESEDHESS